jgi:hypothetical protein
MEIDNPAAFDKDEQAILAAIVPEETTLEEGQVAQPVESPAQVTETAPTQTAATETAPAATAAVTTTEASQPVAQPVAEPVASTEQPKGDTRAALRAARHAEKRARDEAERLRQELEALKSGKAPVNNTITDAELEELERDFPAQAKIARQQRDLQEQLSRLTPAPAQPEFVPVTYDPAIQEVIDGIPDLLAWQYDPQAQDKFQRAVAYDRALQNDPDWAGKSFQERFTEAAERTKRAFAPASTAPTPTTPSAAPAAAPRNDPAKVIEQAPVEGPKGISDFRGGAPGNAPSLDYRRMTDEQIMASLPAG